MLKRRSGAMDYRKNRSLLTRLNRDTAGLMKDDLGGKIMVQFAALQPKLYSRRSES